jgi:endonuclease G, mitochondrial
MTGINPRRLVVALALALGCSGCCSKTGLPAELHEAADGRPEVNVAWNCFAGIPTPVSSDSAPDRQAQYEPVYHRGFVVLYCNDYRIPAAVCHRLTREQTCGFWGKRAALDFDEDRQLQGPGAQRGDYEGPDARGLDPGHMASSADFDADRGLMRETFLLSNVAPQRKSFNRGVWRKLEVAVRRWVRDRGAVYVVTGTWVGGPTSSSLPEPPRIGTSGVVIPRGFFKAVVWRTTQGQWRLTCILLPHDEKEIRRVTKHVVTLAELEQATGLRLFPDLSEAESEDLQAAGRDFVDHLVQRGL